MIDLITQLCCVGVSFFILFDKIFWNGNIGAKTLSTARNVPINKSLWMYEGPPDLCQGDQHQLADCKYDLETVLI